MKRHWKQGAFVGLGGTMLLAGPYLFLLWLNAADEPQLRQRPAAVPIDAVWREGLMAVAIFVVKKIMKRPW